MTAEIDRASIVVYTTNLEHSFDDSKDEHEINRISGGHGGEDRENCGAQGAVANQFHASYSSAQQTSDQLRGHVSVKERTQNRTPQFRTPVEFARLSKIKLKTHDKILAIRDSFVLTISLLAGLFSWFFLPFDYNGLSIWRSYIMNIVWKKITL